MGKRMFVVKKGGSGEKWEGKIEDKKVKKIKVITEIS